MQTLKRGDEPLLSIVIKALNEDQHIERCIESAMRAVREVDGAGEVILADSLSSDRTVELARRYPIHIVQLTHPGDRSCGVGAQLGYQFARGRYVYVLDGDMELQQGFVAAALARMMTDSKLGGVAGLVDEAVLVNQAFIARARRADTSTPNEAAASLNMGGLYRADAIREIGYLTDRNLHAFEELDLGLRLTQRGWRMVRINLPAVRHHGPNVNSARLMLRRWRTRYAWGHGQLLRKAIGAGFVCPAVRALRVLRPQTFCLSVWGAALAAGLGWSETFPVLGAVCLACAVWIAIWLLVAAVKRSFAAAAYSVSAWHVGLAGLVCGLFKPVRACPTDPVECRQLQ